MKLLDYINLILIGGCALFCVVKGFKKKSFKKLAFIYAVVLACFVARSYSGLLLVDVDIIHLESELFGEAWTEKINSAIVIVLGTIIMTVELHIMLKLIFRVVDGNMDKDIYTVVMDRLRGAVDGLFIFDSISQHLMTSNVVLAQTHSIKITHTRFLLPEKINIYRLVRNLN